MKRKIKLKYKQNWLATASVKVEMRVNTNWDNIVYEIRHFDCVTSKLIVHVKWLIYLVVRVVFSSSNAL